MQSSRLPGSIESGELTPFALTPPIAAGILTGPRPTQTSGHLPALDGIRGVAIASVLVYHVGLFGHHVIGHSATASRLERGLVGVSRHGWLGVDLFFALSGFLITGILFDAKGRTKYLRTFFGRRALRIFPLYYAALLLLLVISIQTGEPAAQRAGGAWAWLYLVNMKMVVSGTNAVPKLLQHFWSLSIEEQFYLVWPFLVLATSRRGMMRVCVGSFLLAIALRIGLTPQLRGPAEWLMPARLDALAAGSWVALALRGDFDVDRARRSAGWVMLIAGGGVLVALAATSLYVKIPNVDFVAVSIPLSALLFAATIASVALSRSSTGARLLSTAAPRFLGRYSYAIYVMHQPIILLMLRGAPFQRAATAAGSRLPAYGLLLFAVSASAIAAALVSWHLWEKHFLRLKSRLTYGAALVAGT